MTVPSLSPIPKFQFVQLIDVQALIAEATRPILERLTLIESLQDEWVDTKTALRITGIKQAETLKAERERKGTSVIVKFEGKTRKMPRYSRLSLIAYNEAKTKRRIVGRSF